ncbi:flagellar biosynthesis anti-sigma factor FlgM [Hydrogenophaga sp.]|uniref:flagellar biosynthesis anti-sigma factor FlgM n=1 Tax=Hydrogenophaga sp. TaxID=1904254 RepID=UPI003563B302
MKIDGPSDSHIGSVAGGPNKVAERPLAGATPAAAVGGPATPQQGVTVTLSSATQAASSSGGGEVFNADKVEAMRNAIATGSFQVNAEAIADKLLSNAAEMLNSARA